MIDKSLACHLKLLVSDASYFGSHTANDYIQLNTVMEMYMQSKLLKDPATPDDSEEKNPEITEEQARKYLAVVNQASQLTRDVHLIFLLVGIYLAILFGSTNHKQLLLESNAMLPLLNVEMPIVEIYRWAPLGWIILHFNMLLLLSMLTHKSGEWLKLIRPLSNETYQSLLTEVHAFPFTQWLVSSHPNRRTRNLFSAYALITTIIFPVGILLLAQVRFLPYHGIGITWMHRVYVVADLYLLWYFWREIREQHLEFRESAKRFDNACSVWFPQWIQIWRQRLHRITESVRCRLFSGEGEGLEYLYRWAIYGTLVFCFFVATIPDELVDLTDPNKVDYIIKIAKDRSEPIDIENVDTKETLRNIHNKILIRNLSVRNEVLVKESPSQEIVSAYLRQAMETGDIIEKAEDRAWVNHAKGLDLRNRNLSYADFTGSKMYKVIFGKGDPISGINYTPSKPPAILNATIFNHAKLNKASFDAVIGNGIQLSNTDLSEASFLLAKIPKANFGNASLVGAWLQQASLIGSVVRQADLRGAYLEAVNLSGADLSMATLRGASLRYAHLIASDLYQSDMSGTDLYHANLAHAELSQTDFTGAYLKGANLSGVVQRSTDSNTMRKKTSFQWANLEISPISKLSDKLLNHLIDDLKLYKDNSFIRWIPGGRYSAISTINVNALNRLNNIIYNFEMAVDSTNFDGAHFSSETISLFQQEQFELQSITEEKRFQALGDAYLCNDFYIFFGIMRQLEKYRERDRDISINDYIVLIRAFLSKSISEPKSCPMPIPSEGVPSNITDEYNHIMDKLQSLAYSPLLQTKIQ